jgi:hypothetical protein
MGVSFMKRFLAIMTVSITMAGMAFADNPAVDPDMGEDIGFPFHPGAWITTTSDTDYEWNECFCMPSDTYEEFPASTVLDPTVIEAFDVLRMTHASTTAIPFAGSTYVQNPNEKTWEGRVLDMTFYFAAQTTADAVGFYVSADQVVTELDNKMDFDGLAFLLERDPATQFTYISIYDGTGLVASSLLPIVDPNFHLMRVRYDDYSQSVKVETFEWFEGVTIIDWTAVSGVPTSGWLGFGAFAGMENQEYVDGYQYIDDICLTIHDDHEDTVDAMDLPNAFELKQNHPNPFNPTTSISFVMSETGMATLTVFDLAGREVSVLHDGLANAGENQVSFDGSALTSGVYFYSLETESQLETRKMVLVK